MEKGNITELDVFYHSLDNMFKGVKDSLPLDDSDISRGMKFMLFLLHERVEEEYVKIKYKGGNSENTKSKTV